MNAPVRRTVAYLRLSLDRQGDELGVARQREDIVALCSQNGWALDDTLSDNDQSAIRGVRPEFEALLERIAAGEIARVVSWASERLWKSRRDEFRLYEACRKGETHLAFVRSPDIDLSTPGGRLIADFLGAAARHETEVKADRQTRATQQAAELGKRAGVRGYGYDLTYDRDEVPRRVTSMTINETEAQVIREVAARLIAGERLGTITRDLTSRGVVSATGIAFSTRVLRRVMCSARISGRREYKPVASYDKGRPLIGEILSTSADWPAIISAEDSDRVRAILTSRANAYAGMATGRRYLLSGVLRCGNCGHGLTGAPHHTRKDGSVAGRYWCVKVRGGLGCATISTGVDRTDEFVRDIVLVALDSPEMRERLSKREEIDPALIDAIDEDSLQLEDLAAMLADRVMTRKEWQAARDRVMTRLEANTAKLEAQRAVKPLQDFIGSYADMLKRWRDMTDDRRRPIVAALIEKIVVNGARQGARFDPDRFSDPVWRV